MKKLLLLSLLALAACQAPPAKKPTTLDQINDELNRVLSDNRARPASADPLGNALMPPLKIELPGADGRAVEPKFDLVVNNAPAKEVFMGIVSGTRYSMLVHPEVSGTISANLKDVTVRDALDAIREIYGYDYRMDGTRIYVQPLTLQTRVFQVNYLTAKRVGTSEIQVTSSSINNSNSNATGTSGAATTTTGNNNTSLLSSKIVTSSSSDFWVDLKSALTTIVGAEGGRNVVVSPQSGVVVIRAMPNELRAVDQYLKATQLSVDRQVILEAKIIEVELSEGFQSGINWAAFAQNGTLRASRGADASRVNVPNSTVTTDTTVGDLLGNTLAGTLAAARGITTGGLFGLVFQTSSFAALIQYLETQGTVHVLSSPRISTLNNQKAVLKVGTDDFFVTNVSTTTTSTATTGTTSPNVTLQPFFSGISLDVTPQIDDASNIILHIHPSVSDVTTRNTEINLGTSGTLNLPLASSKVSETDSIVRAEDGQVVAIGGLMRSSATDGKAQVPGTGSVPGISSLLGNTGRVITKRELVILLKPAVVKGNETWTQNILESQRNVRVIQEQTGAAGSGR